MAYQAEVPRQGPQNITKGTITLNEVQVYEGWTQYEADTVFDWCEEHELTPTTDIAIAGELGFSCSSSDVVN